MPEHCTDQPCDRSPYAKGVCRAHYMRRRRANAAEAEGRSLPEVLIGGLVHANGKDHPFRIICRPTGLGGMHVYCPSHIGVRVMMGCQPDTYTRHCVHCSVTVSLNREELDVVRAESVAA